MPLPLDVCRCYGSLIDDAQTCEKRETCKRYRDREIGAQWTPFSGWLCDEDFDHYIPVTGASSDD